MPSVPCGSLTLYYSINRGFAPLTVGFFLYGSNVDQIKKWNFDDGIIEGPDRDLVKNHIYSTAKSQPYIVSIEVIDSNDKSVGSCVVEIKVDAHQGQIIDSLYQTEGVIILNPYPFVGCSISTQKTVDDTLWNWGDPQTDRGPDKLNPWHKYNFSKLDPPFNGQVTVWNYGIPDYWNFSTMVLQYLSVPQDVRIEINISTRIHGASPHVGDEVTFIADRGPPPPGWTYTWKVDTAPWKKDFDRNPISNNIDSHIYKRTFDTPLNYVVICMLSDGRNYQLSGSRSFNVQPPIE